MSWKRSSKAIPFSLTAPPPYTPEAAHPGCGTTALVLGLIALVGGFACCGVPIILGPFAWMSGNNYEKECARMGVEPRSEGKAGKILGIIATVLLILGVVSLLGLFLLGALGAALEEVH